MFHATAWRPHTAATLRSLGDLDPTTLALMHGPSFSGDGKRAFYDLAAAYEAARRSPPPDDGSAVKLFGIRFIRRGRARCA